ncbi:DUF488 domain-containing protein [Hymenobacter sp. ISL-91]|uniref:DUF488 domain-containing protein n=1 Tax=Hymenobacter sp. ISL-91 TaxID=2819151 RepID=UPI001BE5951C|nr:DUF488 domain-containing protein [Hymenobacter sp. ISL-91]MBT2558220.1 DUF488 domain-containing protein [Hymenobacter sp. ISL-91]
MFYRRKIALALIQGFGGELSKISFHKLLFLFTIKQSKPDYDFVPYKYGCYSFSANADLTAMVKHGQITEGTNIITKIDSVNYIKSLSDTDKKILIEINNKFKDKTIEFLINTTYTNYKYYATRSEISKNHVSTDVYQQIIDSKPKNDKTILYTIGYEGISLESYLNKLIKNDIKLLIDVRRNALSMKFGFSKKQLTGFCEKVGISYLHIPKVGIQSDQRQELKTQSDYDNLFKKYTNTTINETQQQQNEIIDLLKINKRIALTCFEANVCQCHRKHLAEAITRHQDWNFELKHL